MKLTIVPHNTGRARQIRVNNFLLFLAGLVVVVTFIDRYSRAKTLSEPEELVRNNKYLEEELKNEQEEYRDIANECDVLLSLTTEHQSVRAYCNTPLHETAEGTVGVGGSRLGTPTPDFVGMTEEEVQPQGVPAKTIDELLVDLHNSKFLLDNVSTKLHHSPEVAKFTPSIAPVEGYVVRTFGKTEYIFTGEQRFCEGIDFAAPVGSKVHSTAYGVVKFAGVRPHAGLTVEIEHISADFRPDGSFITKYSHLSLLKVSNGQSVQRGEVIGFVGTTGKTIGPMLHYEVWVDGKPRNPVDFILTEVSYF